MLTQGDWLSVMHRFQLPARPSRCSFTTIRARFPASSRIKCTVPSSEQSSQTKRSNDGDSWFKMERRVSARCRVPLQVGMATVSKGRGRAKVRSVPGSVVVQSGDLPQQFPGVQSRRVAVTPGKLEGIGADGLHALKLQVGGNGLLADDPLASPLVAAACAGTMSAEEPVREPVRLPVRPGDFQN